LDTPSYGVLESKLDYNSFLNSTATSITESIRLQIYNYPSYCDEWLLLVVVLKTF